LLVSTEYCDGRSDDEDEGTRLAAPALGYGRLRRHETSAFLLPLPFHVRRR
jgi:hypothetical protein